MAPSPPISFSVSWSWSEAPDAEPAAPLPPTPPPPPSPERFRIDFFLSELARPRLSAFGRKEQATHHSSLDARSLIRRRREERATTKTSNESVSILIASLVLVQERGFVLLSEPFGKSYLQAIKLSL